MKNSKSATQQLQFLAPSLAEMLNPKDPLYQLALEIDWVGIENELSPLYADFGRPAHPIRLLVGLHLLKHMFNLGDETIVKAWSQNPYYQFFTGESVFQWKLPIAPSDMVHFRKRVGEKGVQKLLEESIRLHGESAREDVIIADTTAQEKNITYPTDVKLYIRIIEHCWKIADKEKIELRQRYSRILKHLRFQQRLRKSKKDFKKAIRAEKKLKTIAGRLVRELFRKLPKAGFEQYASRFDVYQLVLLQKRGDKEKIYSIHEPDTYCMAKGKESKKYEFGSKVSVLLTKDSGIVVGAKSFEKNLYDGHTLPLALAQYEEMLEKRPKEALVDLGYRGPEYVGETKVLLAGRVPKELKDSARYRMKKKLNRRSAIEPVLGHMKSRFRLCRNFLSGLLGDAMNVMLAAAAFNMVKRMNLLTGSLCLVVKFILAMIKRVSDLRYGLENPTFEFKGAF